MIEVKIGQETKVKTSFETIGECWQYAKENDFYIGLWTKDGLGKRLLIKSISEEKYFAADDNSICGRYYINESYVAVYKIFFFDTKKELYEWMVKEGI